MALLPRFLPSARATEGVIKLDIARVLMNLTRIIATAVYEDAPLSSDRSPLA